MLSPGVAQAFAGCETDERRSPAQIEGWARARRDELTVDEKIGRAGRLARDRGPARAEPERLRRRSASLKDLTVRSLRPP